MERLERLNDVNAVLMSLVAEGKMREDGWRGGGLFITQEAGVSQAFLGVVVEFSGWLRMPNSCLRQQRQHATSRFHFRGKRQRVLTPTQILM